MRRWNGSCVDPDQNSYRLIMVSSVYIDLFAENVGSLRYTVLYIGVGRGGGGAGPPNNLRRGGGTYPLAPHNPPTFSFNFYVLQEKITNVPS